MIFQYFMDIIMLPMNIKILYSLKMFKFYFKIKLS